MLVYLSGRARPTPAMMIANACGLPKSSAYHLLNVMRQRNFVTYYPTERRWGLGLAAFEVGSAYLRSEPLERLGRPLIRDLANAVGEVTHLAVLHGSNVLYLLREIPPQRTRALAFDVGVRVPAHLTATGRAMLMRQTPGQLDALMPMSRSLPGRLGENTYLRSTLDTELAAARKLGYAGEDGLIVKGVSCLAAPVLSYEGYAVAAIGTSFYTREIATRMREELAMAVVDAADQLSHLLGWS